MINEHVSLVLKEMLESALYKNTSIKEEGTNQSYLIPPKRKKATQYRAASWVGILCCVSSSSNTLTIDVTLQVKASRYIECILTLLSNTF